MAISTVNAKLPRKQYTASAGRTVFAVPFEFFADGDLKVYRTQVGNDPDDAADLLTLTTQYTVAGADVSGGGSITLVTGADAGDIITIEADDDIDRSTAFLSNGDLTIASMNEELNKLIMLNKQLSMVIEERTIRMQRSAQVANTSLELPNPEASKVIGWNPSATAIINVAQFAEHYFGPLAAAPTVNPYTDGAIVAGDMYFDTVIGFVIVYNGVTWIQIDSSVATSAGLVNITDAGGYYTGTEVETALQEIGPFITGARQRLATASPSAQADVEFIDVLDNTFHIFEVEFINAYASAASQSLQLDYSDDSGSTYVADTFTMTPATFSNSAVQPVQGKATLYSPNTVGVLTSGFCDSQNQVTRSQQTYRDTSGVQPFDTLKLTMSGGATITGIVNVYGVAPK